MCGWPIRRRVLRSGKITLHYANLPNVKFGVVFFLFYTQLSSRVLPVQPLAAVDWFQPFWFWLADSITYPFVVVLVDGGHAVV